MPQQYKACPSRAERNLLADVGKAYHLGSAFCQTDSLVVWENRIVIAFSADGQRYFLKQWPSYVASGQEVAFVLAIQAYARDGGVPIPRILKTMDGRHILDWAGRRFSLYEFVGQPYDPCLHPGQIVSCARTLGILHRAVKDAQVGGKAWRDDPFSYSMSFIRQAKDRLPEHPLCSASKGRVARLLDDLCDLLDKAKQRLMGLGWQDLPRSPIHGDYCQFNCRFDKDVVVGVVDWDHARLGPRLLDIAHAVNIGLGWRSAIDYYEDFRWQHAVLPYRQELVNWYVEYGSTAPPLSDREAQLLPLVCTALWPAPSGGFEPKCEAEIPGCDAIVATMRHFLNEAEDISRDLKSA